MKRENIDQQLFLYENGNTSLEEEKELINHLGQSKSGVNAWFAYLKVSKMKVPKNLKSDIWDSIQKLEKRKKMLRIRLISAAASVILAVSLILTIDFHPQKLMSNEEKTAAIEEALAMISETSEKPVLGDILYEDEKLIIYIK